MRKNKTASNGTEQYKGPGKMVGLLGESSIWSIPGAVISAIGAIIGAVGYFSDPEIDSKEHKFDTTTKAGIAVAVTGALTAAVGSVIGAVKGYKRAKRGKEQFTENQERLQHTAERAQTAEQRVEQLHTEKQELLQHIISKRDGNTLSPEAILTSSQQSGPTEHTL